MEIVNHSLSWNKLTNLSCSSTSDLTWYLEIFNQQFLPSSRCCFWFCVFTVGGRCQMICKSNTMNANGMTRIQKPQNEGKGYNKCKSWNTTEIWPQRKLKEFNLHQFPIRLLFQHTNLYLCGGDYTVLYCTVLHLILNKYLKMEVKN